jgi:hypothetical protein
VNGYSNFINAVKRQRNLGLIESVKWYIERAEEGDNSLTEIPGCPEKRIEQQNKNILFNLN